MRIVRWLSVLTVGIAACVRPAQGVAPTAFGFVCDVVSEPLVEDEMLAVPLTEALYRRCEQGAPDMRLFDAEGTEVPYMLDKQQTTERVAVMTAVEASIVQLDELPGNRLQVLLRLEAEEKRGPVDALDIVTPLRDFEKRISVQVPGNAPDTWTTIVDRHPLFDFTRFMDVRNTRVPLPGRTAARQFRLIVDDIRDEEESAVVRLSREMQQGETTAEKISTVVRRRDFRIDRIQLLQRQVRTAARAVELRDSALHDIRVEPGDDGASTEIGLRTDGQPLTGVRLVTSHPNFSRQVRICVPREGPAGREWCTIGRARVERLTFRNIDREQLEVTFGEIRDKELKVVIEDGDAPPLEIDSVDGIGPVYRIVFLGEQGHTYRLHLGSSAVEAPAYDTALLRTLTAGKPGTVRSVPAGPAQPNTGYKPARLAWFESRWLLWGVVGLMLVVLPWAMLRAVRKIDPIGPGPGSPDGRGNEPG